MQFGGLQRKPRACHYPQSTETTTSHNPVTKTPAYTISGVTETPISSLWFLYLFSLLYLYFLVERRKCYYIHGLIYKKHCCSPNESADFHQLIRSWLYCFNTFSCWIIFSPHFRFRNFCSFFYFFYWTFIST
jgi:hypothetical protein